MLKTLGIVEASPAAERPSEADRLGKLPLCRFAGQPLVEWVVRRVTESQRLDGVIVLVADTVAGRQAASLVPPDVPVCISGELDPLSRVADALGKYRTVGAVRVRVDSPFVDPHSIDGLIRAAERDRDCDYISYCSRDGRPSATSRLGVFAEWCRAAALRRANRDARDWADRYDATRYVYTHPELFHLRLIQVPAELDRPDVRLTIDVQEDWEHLEQIFDALGRECLDWQRIAGLLDQQPALRRRMAVLNRVHQGS
jgi:spore coat polysaccharide biosynthesis protein SpsF